MNPLFKNMMPQPAMGFSAESARAALQGRTKDGAMVTPTDIVPTTPDMNPFMAAMGAPVASFEGPASMGAEMPQEEQYDPEEDEIFSQMMQERMQKEQTDSEAAQANTILDNDAEAQALKKLGV
jgi:hypothetical protein